MAQYQSFPGVPGDSQTLAKLKALRLPPLSGKRFLDVGCNEGFFCGYAEADGASSVVGLDASDNFIERARSRFPRCEFLARGWDQLPPGPFDVILFASAIHYAADQEAILRELADLLTPDGTLVLEVGVVTSERSEWVKVRRGSDERFFPTLSKLTEVLEPYAWKHMGPSVSQTGDPVPRHVFHIRRRKPVAYLLMQPPGYGKSTIARSLFKAAGVTVVSGDQLIHHVARGKLAASPELTHLISSDFSSLRIDQAIARVLADGRGAELIMFMLAHGVGKDFALDAFIPAHLHQQVEDLARDAGYMPVVLKWNAPNAPAVSAADTERRADAYLASLGGVALEASNASAAQPRVRAGGFVDDIAPNGDGTVRIRGWAVDVAGNAPDLLEVSVKGQTHTFSAAPRIPRPDVQKRLELDHDLVGFELQLPIDATTAMKSRVVCCVVGSGRDMWGWSRAPASPRLATPSTAWTRSPTRLTRCCAARCPSTSPAWAP
jgi:SAM-dependent methyltransferase